MTTKSNYHMAQIVPSPDLMIQLPPEALEALDIKEGEKVSVKATKDSISISKLVPVEIELDDADFLALAKLAHERDITFNEYVREILEKMIERYQKEEDNATEYSD